MYSLEKEERILASYKMKNGEKVEICYVGVGATAMMLFRLESLEAPNQYM